jgi:2-polyprenyl-6-hydroxyphenyl methylase/3-demethylubiquinone-9 3-methyltransferase
MPEINNAFYEDLGDAWWTADDHMIAFLRQESAIRIDYILKHLPVSDGPLNILDLGAGGGLISIPLARLGHQMTAVDLSEASLKVMRDKAKSAGIENRITTICGNIQEPLPLTGPFDAILAMDV